MAARANRRAEHASARPASRTERAVLVHRARRRARVEWERERKRARTRFAVLLLTLLFVALVLSLSILDQIQSLFGL